MIEVANEDRSRTANVAIGTLAAGYDDDDIRALLASPEISVPEWFTIGGIVLASPGGHGLALVELSPGSHRVVCALTRADGGIDAVTGLVALDVTP